MVVAAEAEAEAEAVVAAAVAEVAVVGVVVAAEVVGGPPPQLGNLKQPILVLHSACPDVWMYSFVYQKVQSSTGSVAIIE